MYVCEYQGKGPSQTACFQGLDLVSTFALEMGRWYSQLYMEKFTYLNYQTFLVTQVGQDNSVKHLD